VRRGCDTIDVDETTNRFMAGGKVVREGDFISLNGTTGEVILGKAPLIAPAMTGAFAVFMSWADAVRRLKVRANADTQRDARVARNFGAEGIGLCRTEHMFFAEDRIPIMAGDDPRPHPGGPRGGPVEAAPDAGGTISRHCTGR